MKQRVRLAAGLSAFAIAGLFAVPATANPGLLHKHGARPVGVPAMLPGQSPTVASTATTSASAGGSAPAAGTSSIAVAGVAPGSAGCVVVAGGADGPVVPLPDGLPIVGTSVDGSPVVDPGQLPICVMPAPDGRGPGPEGRPHVWHRLNPGAIDGHPGPIDAGAVDSGLVMVDVPPAGFVPWGSDAGTFDGAGNGPMVLSAALPPGGPGTERGGPGFGGHSMNMAIASAASAPMGDGAGSGGRALAAGLPNRAAGVRTDALAAIRHHGPRPTSAPNGVAASGDDSSGSVVQAGGIADDTSGTVHHDRQAKLAGAAAGQVGVPPAATPTPRWRDRFRFAWPMAK